MHLIHYKIHSSNQFFRVLTGHFTNRFGSRITTDTSSPSNIVQQYVLVTNNQISLWIMNEVFERRCIVRQNVYGIIRSVEVFPGPPGGNGLDYLVVGTDSGRLMIWQYEGNGFKIVRAEAFGKSGARRIVPGEYVAVDPLSRAIMIAAVEKQKFVYELNRDSSEAQNLTVSSPLSAHSDKTIVIDICAVDTDEENPIFAAIEIDYSEADESNDDRPVSELTEKVLVFYEVDQGSHAVTRREKKPIPATSNKLIPVPGGTKGPGGVLVCSENFLTYRNLDDDEEVQVAIPQRQDAPYGRGLLVTSFTTESDFPFIIMQSEYGDLYFVQVEKGTRRGSSVTVSIRYYDTVPRATSIAIFKIVGMLFIATEFGDHRFYQVKSLGEESDQEISGEIALNIAGEDHSIPVFYPHELLHLVERSSARIKNTAPILDVEIQDIYEEGVPQYFCLTGHSSQSSLRILRHGLWMGKVGIRTFPEETVPTAVFTMKRHKDDKHHKYILISLEDRTLVLGVNGKEIVSVDDTLLEKNVSTLDCGLMGEKTLCQIHSRGINFITDGVNRPWNPSPKKINCVAMNGNQLVVALSGGQLAYFEYDHESGTVEERATRDMGQDVACLCVGPISEGIIRSPFLGVGFFNRSAQILSLDPAHRWDEIASLTLTADPSSMRITEMYSGDKTEMHFNIGMDNGVLQRTQMSKTDGKLQKDLRLRILGTKGVKLFDLQVNGKPALAAVSSRTWLHFTHNDTMTVLPLNVEAGTKRGVVHITNLNSEIVANGFCLVTPRDFVISNLDNVGETFSQTEIPLKYTPRKICTHPISKKFVILETDHNALRESEKAHSEQVEGTDDMLIDTENGTQDQSTSKNGPVLSERDYGAPMTIPNSGKWASYIRIVDPHTLQTLQYMEIPEGEAALSMCICTFQQKPGDTFLLVGTAKNHSLVPRKCDEAYIRTYRFTNKDYALEFVHKSQVEDIPTAFHPFQNQVLVGIRNILRVYSYGQKKLLRISENRKFPNIICRIESERNRIFVSDVSESFFYVNYNPSSQQLSIFADNTIPRWLTSSAQLDYDTLAGGDKFGNFFVTRVPRDVVEDVESMNRGGTSWMWQRGLLNGAPQKAQEIVQFHLGDIITNMKKVNLIPRTPGVIVYTTILGSIGIFMPIVSRSDVEFFSLLEMHLRKECPPLSGRDHLEYRSSFHPCRNTIDGDLLESFQYLPLSKQEEIAKDLETDVSDILKKIEMLRADSGF